MASVVQKFKQHLDALGLAGAIRWLNQRVPYRYTAIFAFDRDILRNVLLVDKQDPSVTNCPDQSVTESYCIYIQRTLEPFSLTEARLDPRVASHPKRDSFQCYYGIPLFDDKGKILGTVCHFDETSVQVTEEVVDVLDDLAPLIALSAFKTE